MIQLLKVKEVDEAGSDPPPASLSLLLHLKLSKIRDLEAREV